MLSYWNSSDPAGSGDESGAIGCLKSIDRRAKGILEIRRQGTLSATLPR